MNRVVLFESLEGLEKGFVPSMNSINWAEVCLHLGIFALGPGSVGSSGFAQLGPMASFMFREVPVPNTWTFNPSHLTAQSQTLNP